MKKSVLLLFKSIGIIIFAFIVLIVIQILQSGTGGWNGKSLEEQFGEKSGNIRYEEIKDLPKSRLIQVFYAAEPPDIYRFEGEYLGELAPVGVLFFMGEFFTKYIYGNGDTWIGKGFKPCGKEQCWGYNIFKSKDNPDKIIRKRKMATYVGRSNIDKKNSYMIDYTPYNSGLVHIFRDEMRKINDELYIGMGYLNFPGGSYINFPFILHGKPGKWSGLTE